MPKENAARWGGVLLPAMKLGSATVVAAVIRTVTAATGTVAGS
jgi:hypothetical protein